MLGFGSARNSCWLSKSQGNNIQRQRVDSEEIAAPFDLEIVNENEVGADLEIVTETPSKGDAWICKCRNPCWLRKS